MGLAVKTVSVAKHLAQTDPLCGRVRFDKIVDPLQQRNKELMLCFCHCTVIDAELLIFLLSA